MKSNKTKYILFILVVLLMLIPLVFGLFPIIKEKELKGYFENTPKPELSMENWTNLNYQNNIEKYTKENIGFRNFFVRTYNQINYSFFNTTNAVKINIGRNHYLYEDGYIENPLGINFSGEDTIVNYVNLLSLARDSMEELGMKLIIVIAPGKGSFYPEYFPSKYKDMEPGITNFKIIDRELKKHNINYIDFNSYMISLKGKSKYRLFPNTGLHWGEYASYLAIDSITNYFEDLYSINLPRIRLKSVEVNKEMRFEDDDAEQLMNLFFNIPDHPMPRVVTTIDSNGADKIDVLIMGDSYYSQLSRLGLDKYVFNNSEFWYYFNEVYSYKDEDYNKSLKGMVRDYEDIKAQMLKYDAVMILITEGTLNFTPQLFFKELHSQFTNDYRARQYNSLYMMYKKAIINDKNWYNDIQKKAKNRGVSIEQAINDDAGYMVEEYLKNQKQ